jgi:hypothetical protein
VNVVNPDTRTDALKFHRTVSKMADDVVHGRCDTGCEAMDELAAAAAVFAMDIDPDAIEEVELEETYGA